MSNIKKNLEPANNFLNSYFPSRTSIAKEGDFDWSVAAAAVVRNLYRKQINFTKLLKKFEGEASEKLSYAMAEFEMLCQEGFENTLDDPDLWPVLKDMYFHQDGIYEIAPEASLFRLVSVKASSPQQRLADMFSSLMKGFHLKPGQIVTETNNFLEDQILKTLRSDDVLKSIVDSSKTLAKGVNEKPYLPFLSDIFNQDLVFLISQPKYFREQIENLLRLYGYLYTAQLALNIKSLEEPTAKPLYFILENESASRERTDLQVHGHRAVQKFLPCIFPYLTMSESLQEVDKASNQHRKPLWELVKSLIPEDAPKLKRYAYEFAQDRYEGSDFQFDHDQSIGDPKYWLDVLLKESIDQFGKKKKRAAAGEKFIKTTEAELCSTFVKSRGQVGKVLVMNQDYISLLTNLAIGTEEKLRFSELINEFQVRGIYFDKQSQKALIHFYERVGNVERMSDSGDAVYVRKTL
ncbi:MAG: DNA phosphorothioation-dependent restriction protein DptG [Cellvibrionaceae bacterium]